MKTSAADILIVPGLGGSEPDHWQSRWEERLSTARRVRQADWEVPDPELWEGSLVVAAVESTRPVVIVAHSLGVIAAVRAAPRLPAGRVAGAFLVAPADIDAAGMPPEVEPFRPIPLDPLPFPSILVASRNDPFCGFGRAEDLSFAWGSALADAGEAGHLDPESGYGPWPEGLMRFAAFLKGL